MSDLEYIKNQVINRWHGEICEEREDVIVFGLPGGCYDYLFLSIESGEISIGRHFFYDSEETLSDNEYEYIFERSFFEFLQRHSDYTVSDWHDACFDLGYPGTDYDKYIGFEYMDYSEEMIRQYLWSCEHYIKKVKSFDEAIDYLISLFYDRLDYDGIWSQNNICFKKGKCRYDSNTQKITISYIGTDHYLCKVNDKVFVCDKQLYRKTLAFFDECTLKYSIIFYDEKLVFYSSAISVELKMRTAEKAYLETEQVLLRLKHSKSVAAMACLFNNDENNYVFEQKETKQNKQLTNDIVRASTKMIQNISYNHVEENIRNDALRDLLEMTGYDIKDQSRTGFSAKEKSSGECDLVVYLHGMPFSFIECLNLDGFNSGYIREHICRLFKYDLTGVSVNYILCYVRTNDFPKFIDKYFNLCVNSHNQYEYPLVDVEKISTQEYIPGGATNIRIIKMAINRNNRIVYIYHILLHFEK